MSPLIIGSSDDGEYHGCDVDQDHHGALRTVDLVPQREDEYQDRSRNQDRDVDHRRKVDPDRMDGAGNAEDQQDIEDIGADNITDRQTVFPLARGDDRGHQLGQRGAHRDDRQTDQRLGHTKRGGNIFSGFDNKMSARDDQSNTDQDKQYAFERRHLLDRFTLGLILERRADQHDQIDNEDDQQRNAHPTLQRCDSIIHLDGRKIGRSEHADSQCGKQRDRDDDRERKISLFDDVVERQGLDQRAYAQHHQQVEQVRANDVTHGDLVRAVDRRRGADRQLGSAGTHRHDRQTDDDRRHLENSGKRRAAVHKQIRALDQRDKSRDQQDDLQHHLHFDTLFVFSYSMDDP